MASKLDQLKSMTTVVADTGDIDAIKKYKPTDSTTNPSLILSAAQKPQYKHLIDDAVNYAKGKAKSPDELRILLMNKLYVNFGVEILKIVPGRVSTELNARFSFDTETCIEKAKLVIKLYEEAGIPRERILIKIASTWEGIRAAKELEKMGIHCNLTLMFSMPQAIACAEAGVTLISPFVGRILDWYKKAEGVSGYAPAEDPGVKSVTEIYNYYKHFDYKTQIMGASFRNIDQILELAGCDLLTIAPDLLEQLSHAEGQVPKKLDPSAAHKKELKKIPMDEKTFRYMFNENAMATEKLAEGIRKFAEDTNKLCKQVAGMYGLQV